jgi:hypothetical protein
MSRHESHLIVTLLVNTDFVIIPMHVYVCGLVTPLSIENITTTISGAKSIIVKTPAHQFSL